ncbi:hypothetical protein [Streptomyces griseoaurantiacus]|uniref:hypothetical protein n=1 Tax=Streptomyces TaxID=1883 RepID=UPI0030E1AFF5
MNDTVAVALITSLSTLTAAGLAGWVSARTNDRQLRHQAALAREERAERRALDRRELRRETYERFLARADAAYRLLDEWWQAPPSARAAAAEEGFAARRALDEALVRVRLAGPEEVAERARAVVRGVGEEFRTHAGAARTPPDAAHRRTPAPAGSAPSSTASPRTRALRSRETTTDAFLAAARTALREETP